MSTHHADAQFVAYSCASQKPGPQPIVRGMDDALLPEIAMLAHGIDDNGDIETSDEDVVRAARERYRRGIPLMEPDEIVGPHLEEGERLFEFQAAAALREVDDASRSSADSEGLLYISNRRILHVAASPASFPLSEIAELTVTSRGLLVGLVGHRGIIIALSQPRQVRAMIAAAMNAARR